MAFDYVTVTVRKVETITDQYGDQTQTVTETDVENCLFAPRASTERADPTVPAVITGGAVYLPSGAVQIDADDQLIIDGDTWTVEGDPGVWGTVGVEIAVKRWEQR